MSYSSSSSPGFFYRDGQIYNSEGMQFQVTDSAHDAISTIANTMQSFQSPIPYGSPLEQSVRDIVRRVVEEEILERTHRGYMSDSHYSSQDGSYRSSQFRDERRLGVHLDLDGNKIANLATPQYDFDAATKAYVDSQISLAAANVKEELKQEMLGDGVEALKLRVRTFSLIDP